MTTYGAISFDTSEIKDLAKRLEIARERPHKVRATALREVAARVESEAKQNVAGYNKASTGELLAAIRTEGTPVYQRIFADVKQALFLEYGTPTTGSPRPWLTGPAQKGADELFEELSKAAEIF